MSVDREMLRGLLAERSLTQSRAAELARISRATLANFLGGKTRSFQAGTATRLAEALGLQLSDLQTNGIKNDYLECLRKQHACLDHSGLGILSAQASVPIDQGFIPLRVREDKSDVCDRDEFKRDGNGRNRREFPPVGALEKPQDCTLEDAVKRASRLFLLGEPGSGKTTVLRQLTWALARDEGEDSQDTAVPVFVRLAQWGEQLRDDDNVDLIHAATSQLPVDERATQSMADWLAQAAKSEDVVLLLDGLDEVAEPDLRASVIEHIRRFIQDHSRVRAIVSSRPIGFDRPNLGARFYSYTIQRLENEAIRDFVVKWCTHRHGCKNSEKCKDCGENIERLRHAIVDHPRIAALAANPMMLTILCMLHDANVALPQRRFQLYEKIVEAFLFTWEQKKHSAASGAPDRKLDMDDREVCWLLESIALDMQVKDWTLVPRWWLSEKIRSFLQTELAHEPDDARAQADALLWSLQERSGLVVERGPDRFGFQHLAFQEYFAARALLHADDPIDALRKYLYHPRWREVVRMVAAGLNRHRAPQLVRVILDDPDPTGRLLHRGLLIALGCIADGAPIRQSELLEHIQESVIALKGSAWAYGIGGDAIDLLAELRTTRLAEMARSTVKEFLEGLRDAQRAGPSVFLYARALAKRLIENGSDETAEPEQESDDPVVAIQLEDGRGHIVIASCPGGYDRDWTADVAKQLQSDGSLPVRRMCAEQLGRHAKSDSLSRTMLLDCLAKEPEASVREAIAHALRFTSGEEAVCKLLLSKLEDLAETEEVRGACARALRSAAADDEGVRDTLVRFLDAKVPSPIQAGAIAGLKKCVPIERFVQERLISLLKNETTHEDSRVACIRSLESVLPLPTIHDGVGLLNGLLSRGSADRLACVAAELLARFAATGRAEWGSIRIEQVEQVLVAADSPDEPMLESLRGLVDAREVRKLGISLEKRIEQAFEDLRDRINTMFVFGSSARREHNPDSDIDLMVVGDVTLKELTPGLKRAEAGLGKQINAVLYTRDEFTDRKENRNPFVLRVLGAEKKFIIGAADDFATMGQ